MELENTPESSQIHSVPSLQTPIRLTRRQRMFVSRYLIDFNGVQSAIHAGSKETSAHVFASRMLKNVKVLREIQRLMDERAERLRITSDKVLAEISLLAFANMQDYIKIQDGDAYIDLSALTRDQAAAIKEVTVEEYTEGRGENKRDIKKTRLRLADKAQSLELLGRHLKLFHDSVDHTGTITHVLQAGDKQEASQAVEKIKALDSSCENPIEGEIVDEKP